MTTGSERRPPNTIMKGPVRECNGPMAASGTRRWLQAVQVFSCRVASEVAIAVT